MNQEPLATPWPAETGVDLLVRQVRGGVAPHAAPVATDGPLPRRSSALAKQNFWIQQVNALYAYYALGGRTS